MKNYLLLLITVMAFDNYYNIQSNNIYGFDFPICYIQWRNFCCDCTILPSKSIFIIWGSNIAYTTS